MQYPGTIDNWIDQSGIQAQEAADITPRPLMLAAAAFDRGPEKLTRVYGADFYKLYGYYIDYEKYGQAAIQCANIINNGGELLLKRVVAEDATLANIVVVAKVTSSRVQKTDADGNPLYVDPVSGKETTSAGDNNEKVMINVASIKYELVTVTGKKRLDEVVEEATKSFVQDDETQTFTYPITVIVDNGRGESTKRFNITPQYQISKTQNFMLYKFKYLGSEDLDAESVYFSVVPGVMYLNKSMAIEMACTEMLQCRAKSIEKSIDAFYNKVAEITGFDLDELHKYDLLFGKDNKGNAVQGISYDDNGIDLSAEIGFGLESGSNGAFGDTPILTDEYEKALKDVFDGTFDEDIYNLDLYKIDACVDANYPYEVKKAIYELAKFRKDFYFFGDLGLEVETFSDAQNKMYEMPRDKFTGWYGQSYQILNPFTKRNIDVTIGYSIARMVIPHLVNRTHTPYCGILFNWTIPEAIEGTINFTPKITPAVNQKTLADDLRLNYASVLNNVLTLETEFTSQEELTQLSFINNVTAIQKIIKTVRDRCPSFRYSFISTTDLQSYKKEVNRIIATFTGWFESLEFVYVQDEIMRANKIFEASLKVKHKDFVQSEILNIYTLGTEQATVASADTSLQSKYI
nr:MAG TPA: tail sheath protein [Caudoviricetes sp.]